MMNLGTLRRAGLAAIVLLLLAALPASSLEPSLPADVQAGIIAKLWQLDRNFPQHAPIMLGVAYQEKYRASFVQAHDLCDAFTRARLPVQCVLINISPATPIADQFSGRNIDAVYITPLRAMDVGMLVPILRARRIRTVTAVSEYVDAGVAVGLALRGDHAQIVINLPASRAEGSDFSSQLLKMARVIQ